MTLMTQIAVTNVERWFNSQVWRDGVLPESLFGRLRALAVGPDGALYLSTTNRGWQA